MYSSETSKGVEWVDNYRNGKLLSRDYPDVIGQVAINPDASKYEIKMFSLMNPIVLHRKGAGRFSVGEPVEKSGGDYSFVGTVMSVFAKHSGEVRYVVEDDRGILHIYSDKNLKKAGSK